MGRLLPPQQYYHPQFLQPPPGYGHPMRMPQYQQPMQYQQPTQYQPGVLQIYPPPTTMARASSGASITPTPQEQGTTYMTDQELEQTIGSNSLEIPDEGTQEEEAGDAVVGESQNSDLTVENPYD
jgi:hypothetical protein